MSRTNEAAYLQLGLLVAFACTTTACSAPYQSIYVVSGGGALSKPIPGSESATGTGRATLAPFEFGDVKNGVRPGWSVTGYPLEVEGGASSLRVSAAAVGARLYLFSHFVEITTSNEETGQVTFRGTQMPLYTVTQTSEGRSTYQVFGAGLDAKFAPFAFSEGRENYDGFGEAALFVTGAMPHSYGWGFEFRTGTRYAVNSGGTLFLRLELTMFGSRKRIKGQDEREFWSTEKSNENTRQ